MSKNFDILAYLMGKQAGGGGGGDITVVSKSVSANGTYTAPTGKAYSPVTVSVPASAVDTGTKSITSNGNNQDVVGYAAVDVAVPNSYAAGDEGKVVSNGQLVAQTAHAEVTQNGTIDTTLNNSVVVNVSGGGGDDMLTWTQLATVDCSQNGGNIELTNLDNYLAFYIDASAVQNGSTTASQYGLKINDIEVNSQGFLAIAKAGTTQYQNSYVKFNGLFWEVYVGDVAASAGLKRLTKLQGVYINALNVGKATSFKLTAPASTYYATSGTITIYGGK